MSFFDALTMLGGLALFLFGMNSLGDGLAKLSGGKLENILERLTANKIKAVLLGAGVTAVIQSSSATTVMVVGFVNSGIMKLSQAVGVIFGANIGTTATTWILSLSGISGGNFFVQMLKPSSFSPILALVGVILILFSKKDKKKDVGTILISFAILMFGMETMSGAVAGLENNQGFIHLFTMFKNPILGLIAGAVLTAAIQSSSASIGILQALCSTGAITFSSALPIILGQNIGTCVTAIISAVGANKNAKRAAFVHLYFNLIGTVIFMCVFYGINAFVHFGFLEQSANQLGIAIIHTSFNVLATIVLLPFSKGLERLASITVRDKKEKAKPKNSEMKLLDARFLERPAFAVELSKTTTINMAKVVRMSIMEAIELLDKYDEKKASKVAELEKLVDVYEDELGDYLVKLSAKSLSEHDSRLLSKMLHSIGDLERISDHALNIKEAASEMHGKKIKFSDEAKAELNVLTDAISRIVDLAIFSYINDDKKEALLVEPLEEVIDVVNEKLKNRHIKRLRTGQCTIELGFILSDITNNFERVADHCSNIAACELQIDSDEFESHDYLGRMKKDDENYKARYNEFLEEYKLPKYKKEA
jgi:phosphate:Na+ symporter